MVVERKELKSLEINIQEGIYRLNGEDMKGISRLDVEFNNGMWALLVTKDEIYAQAAPCKESIGENLIKHKKGTKK